MEKSRSKESFPRPCGKYELLEKIGDGGMAEVFRARLPGAAGFEKIVVVKRILPHLAQRKQVVQMFVAEAKLTAEAQHKNIVQVFELVELEDGDFFMVMEYIKGTDLRRLLKNAAKRSFRMPPWFSVHLMIEVLDGLAFVHELTDDRDRPRNIVHRDVTPSNIFISTMGDVKLGDFGIAKDATQAQSELTQAGQLKGKVPYMSPEQLYGEIADQRADVFAAGVVLWECLAQRRLFGGRPDIAAIRMICDGERRIPSQCVPDIPRELDRIVLQALTVDKKRRPANARELQSQLMDVMPSLSKQVRPQEVRRVVETLLGIRPKEEAPSGGVTMLAIDTAHNFLDPEDTSKEKQRAESSPSMKYKGLATDLDLSFETNRPSGDIGEITKAVSTTTPQFSDEEPPMFEGEGDDGDDDVSDWLVTGPHMHDRIHPEVSSRAGGFGPQRWAVEGIKPENYQGPHPFWLRTTDKHVIGPCSLERALELIKSEAKVRLGPSGEISQDSKRWLDLGTFAALTGQEGLLFDDTNRLVETPGSTLGYLDERSPMSVLAWVGSEGLTGKLIFAPEGMRRIVHREIRVLGGAPTYVFANDDALQLPEVLIAKRVLQKKILPELEHAVVATQKSLEDVMAERMPAARYRVMLMKERMADMLRWTIGRFLFDPSAKVEPGPPFARSLLMMLPELIHRGFTTDELKVQLQRVMDVRLEPARGFAAALDELGFSGAQKDAANRIAKGKKLASLIKSNPHEEKILLLVAYALLETQLLIQT